ERKISESHRLTETGKILAQRQSAAAPLVPGGLDVGTAMQPGDAGPRTAGRHALAERLLPGKIREVGAGERADAAPGPEAAVDVEQFVAIFARIILEFDFGHAGVI